MNDLPIGLIIEGLVAVLLLITIGFCVALNRRIRLLRSDEQMLRTVVADLNAATMRAEGAIANLRRAVNESNEALTSQMHGVDAKAEELHRQIAAGEGVIARIFAITKAAQPAKSSLPSAAPQRPASSAGKGRAA